MQLWRGWVGLKQQLDAEQFADSVDNCNDQLHQLKQRWHIDTQATNQVLTKAAELVARLQLDVGYQQARQQVEDHVMRLQDQQQHVDRTWHWRQSCLEAWLAMHQFAMDVAMVSKQFDHMTRNLCVCVYVYACMHTCMHVCLSV